MAGLTPQNSIFNNKPKQNVSRPQTGMSAPAPYARDATQKEYGVPLNASQLMVSIFSDGSAETAKDASQTKTTQKEPNKPLEPLKQLIRSH